VASRILNKLVNESYVFNTPLHILMSTTPFPVFSVGEFEGCGDKVAWNRSCD